jgi:hypothetical protein
MTEYAHLSRLARASVGCSIARREAARRGRSAQPEQLGGGRTGEGQEEKVEKVVAESAIHQHEEGGERFLVLSGVLLLVTAGGLLDGAPGRIARLGAIAGALALAAVVAQVGHTGGQLVYRDGAASAYTAHPGTAAAGERQGPNAEN